MSTGIVVCLCVACFVFGGIVGMIVMVIAAAASLAEEREKFYKNED